MYKKTKRKKPSKNNIKEILGDWKIWKYDYEKIFKNMKIFIIIIKNNFSFKFKKCSNTY